MTSSYTPPGPPALPTESPFLETRAGNWFFLNLLLATPAMLVGVPLLIRAVVGTLGLVQGPAPMLDTIPAVAAYAVPWVGPLFLLAFPLIRRALSLDPPDWARRLLWAFAIVHASVITTALVLWVT